MPDSAGNYDFFDISPGLTSYINVNTFTGKTGFTATCGATRANPTGFQTMLDGADLPDLEIILTAPEDAVVCGVQLFLLTHKTDPSPDTPPLVFPLSDNYLNDKRLGFPVAPNAIIGPYGLVAFGNYVSNPDDNIIFACANEFVQVAGPATPLQQASNFLSTPFQPLSTISVNIPALMKYGWETFGFRLLVASTQDTTIAPVWTADPRFSP